MSFLGKLRNAVLGNSVTREYELGKQIASAGPGLMWKVYAGVKKANRQDVAVFVFNKQTPEFEKLSKKHRDTLIDTLKRGPAQLAKLRHPKLLTIDHPVEDSADSIAFATEPISVCLANILGYHDNLPTPVSSTIKEYDLHPIEIQYGLLEIAEALAFLHDDVHMLHGNLSPESIVLAKSGSWKLLGFEFSSHTQPQGDSLSVPGPSEWDPHSHVLSNPRLEYLAPEYIINRARAEPSDFYSYGMTTYACYNGGRPLFDCRNNVAVFKQNAEQISRITEAALGSVPPEFKTLVRSTLSIDPSVRPNTQLITKHPFFEEVGANTLKYLDTLVEKGDMEKSQFFKKNLARIITKLPKRVVNQRVLPAIAGEFKNSKMVPFLLPLVFLLAEDYSTQDYAGQLWPILIPAFLIQDPVQVPIILLQRMDLLLKRTPQEEVKKHIIPMILRALEGGVNNQLQELCVSVLPTFAGMMDYSSLKHSIVPRLVTTCTSESTSLVLLIKCLVALGKMLDHFDKLILVDQVIPMLEKIKPREPAVLMAILGIYHETVKNKKLGLDKNLLGTKVVPFLIPLAMEPALKLSQFNQFMIVIEEMLYKMVTEQRAHLEQLAAMEQQTESTVAFAQEVAEAKAMDNALEKIGSMASRPTEPQDVTSLNTEPHETDDIFSLRETNQSTKSYGLPLAPKPLSQPSPVAPSLLQPSPVAPSLLQPSPVAPSLLQPSPVAPSLLRPSPVAPSLLQPSPVAPSQGFDADFGPIEWSRASSSVQPSGDQWAGPQQTSQWAGPALTPSLSSSTVPQEVPGGRGLFSGMSISGQNFTPAANVQGQQARLSVGGGSMDWSKSAQTSSSSSFSSVPQTAQPYPAVQAVGIQSGQQIESLYQQNVSAQPPPAKLAPPLLKPSPGNSGQPVGSVPTKSSAPQQSNAMGWSSGVPTQSSTPQQPNAMGWSSGVSTQSSTPQQSNAMGWSSGVSTQSSAPQQSNAMGWSSGVQQQSVPQNSPMTWSLQNTLQPTQARTSAQTQQWSANAGPQTGQNQRLLDNPFADFIA